MLDAKDEHPAPAQLAGIINALGIIDILAHHFLLLLAGPKIRGKQAMPPLRTKSETEDTRPTHTKDRLFFRILLSLLSFFGIV